MPDLHGWLAQQVAEVEDVARLISPGGYEPDTWRVEPTRSGRWVQIVAYSRTLGEPPEAAAREDDQPVALVQSGRREHLLIARHDPDAVLRRCAADRRILERHRTDPDTSSRLDTVACIGCGFYGPCDSWVTDNINDCPELLGLAHAYGITPDVYAALDRPEPLPPKPYPGSTGEVLRDSLASLARLLAPRTPTADVPASLRGPDWKDST